jgi:hypothetical protein
MVLKNIFTAVVCAMLLASSDLAMADEYGPDEFLGLDLPSAVLSPKRLGPATQFAPVRVEARSDRGGGVAVRVTLPKTAVAHPRSEKQRVVHAGIGRHHGNPLDAQAFDTRIQVWPCGSGGICNWKRQAN